MIELQIAFWLLLPCLLLIFGGVLVKDPPLDHPLIHFSDSDAWTIRDSLESILVTGSPGSGKTSTIGKMLMTAMLMAGFGMLILCCKPDEASRVLEVVRQARREQDVILFNAESGHLWDPFYYEFQRPGRGQHDGEAVIDFLSAVMAIGKPPRSSSGEAQYFERASEELSRRTIALLRLAGERVSITNMYRVIASLPDSPGQYEMPEWQTSSFTAHCLNAIKERADDLSEDDWSDLETCIEFFCKTWPGMDPRTTGAIRSTWTGAMDRFNFNPYRRIFSSGRCTFLPEQIYGQGKIVISDWPVNAYGLSTGLVINAGLVKYPIQRALLRRDFRQFPRPVCIWQDEGQLFLIPSAGSASRENAFLQVARSAGVSTVFMTQSISNISEALGDDSINSKTLALLGNFGTRVAMSCNDHSTNLNLSALIGKQWSPIENSSVSKDSFNVGSSMQHINIVEPHHFTTLRKPGGSENLVAEAIVWQGGRRFNCTKSDQHPDGRNFLLTGFSR